MTKELQVETIPQVKSHKMAKLVVGILLAKMYKGNTGIIAAIFGFLEELVPFTDVIPTFTITWVYTYVIKKEN